MVSGGQCGGSGGNLFADWLSEQSQNVGTLVNGIIGLLALLVELHMDNSNEDWAMPLYSVIEQ